MKKMHHRKLRIPLVFTLFGLTLLFQVSYLYAETADKSIVPSAKLEIPEGIKGAAAMAGETASESIVPTAKLDIPEGVKGAAALPAGRELVNMDFPEMTDIKDIVKAVALWTGKNVILDRNVTGKVQIISPKKVTKEEAYQAFISALAMLNLTTVETGKVLKIMKVRSAVRDNLKTYMGSTWIPRTDEVITQIIPLKYVEAKQISTTLSRIVTSNAMIVYEPTNTLIVTDSGYKVRRVIDILALLDVQTQQPQVMMVKILNSDPKSIADKVSEILKGAKIGSGKTKGNYNSFKIMVDERSNSVVIVGPPRTIKDIRDLVKKFDIPIDDPTTQSSIHVRPLDYADAKKLAGTLSSLAGGGSKGANRSAIRRPPGAKGGDSTPSVADLGDGVKITAEETSNSLLVTGPRPAYDALNTIIRKLDVRRSQVYVEADILDLNEDNGFNFGTSIFAGYGKKDGSGAKNVIGWEAQGMAPLVVAGSADNKALTNPQKEQIAGAFAKNMTVGILAGFKVDVPGIGSVSPGALINMIKTDSNTRVLSSPHILTSNNEEAAITVGETLFFNSNTVNPTTGTPIPKVEKENVDLTLEIKPSISHSNYVTLTLNLEQSAVSKIDEITKLPQVTKRKTKQSVTVKNGQTVVVSGLVSTRQLESYSKIPLLGDIPLLGYIFRNSTRQSSKSNLVIFLTPHVVHGPEDLAAIYKQKMAEKDHYLEGVFGSDFRDDEFYKSLPSNEAGNFKPTPADEIESRRLEERKAEVFKAMGYTDEEVAPPTETVPEPQDQMISVPGDMHIDDGGGSGASFSSPIDDARESDMPPPAPPAAPVGDNNPDDDEEAQSVGE